MVEMLCFLFALLLLKKIEGGKFNNLGNGVQKNWVSFVPRQSVKVNVDKMLTAQKAHRDSNPFQHARVKYSPLQLVT